MSYGFFRSFPCLILLFLANRVALLSLALHLNEGPLLRLTSLPEPLSHKWVEKGGNGILIQIGTKLGRIDIQIYSFSFNFLTIYTGEC